MMLTPETFAAVIAARGEVARPRRGHRALEFGFDGGPRWVGRSWKDSVVILSDDDITNACALHWLGMEAEAKWDTTAYFRDGKVDIEALAEAVIAHGPKEGT